ncbi:MAG: hypothetical protein Q8941_01860 [Bacteroidota bacterium]|nr:hypothetical protein [Bacteroidota bacterium]
MPFNNIMRILPVIFCLAILACSSRQTKPVSQGDATSKKAESEPGFRKDFISMYSQPIFIDTFFTAGNKKYHAIFRHFCTMDKGLTVPAKYNFDTHSDFVTHNFESELVLLSGSDTLFKKQITKATFDKLLDSTLKNYADLLYPNFYVEKDSIKVQYSISVPMTDAGIGVMIRFDKKGNYTISE